MSSIMVATDFSERSDRALRRATLLAKEFQLDIHLVHVVDSDKPHRLLVREQEESEKILRELAGTLRSVDDLRCTTRVVLDAPFHGLVQVVKDSKPELLVLGPHRRQLLRDTFVGTTAERTIKAVACPVLMVNALPASGYRNIMLTTDLSDCSRLALKAFFKLGVAQNRICSVLYAFDAPALRLGMSDMAMEKDEQVAYLKDLEKGSAASLSYFLSDMEGSVSRQIVEHEETAPSNVIFKVVAREGVDLIVVGTCGHRGLTKFFLGSVALDVLRSSSVDVLVIPPSAQASDNES